MSTYPSAWRKGGSLVWVRDLGPSLVEESRYLPGDGDEHARAYDYGPMLVRSSGGARGAAPARSAAPSRSTQQRPAAPQLMNSLSWCAVRMTRNAREQLSRSIIGDGCESGGAGFGFYDRANRELVISDIVFAAIDRTRSSMKLDVERIDRASAWHRDTTGWTLVATWHEQPSGQLRPSGTDLRTWDTWGSAERRRSGNDELPFGGLIVSYVDDWVELQVRAFVTEQRSLHRPARFTVGDPKPPPVWHLP